MRATLSAWIRLLRPHQYTKNALIFVPALFAKAWPSLPVVGVGFLLWSIAASALYMVNDAHDAPLDRHHPEKKSRPIAAGLISPTQAYLAAAFLGLGTLGGSFLLSPLWGGLLLLYGLNTLLYTFWLKNLPLWDIFSIAAGFLLRIYGGAVLAEVPVSTYLFMTVFFLSLFLALGKRRQERLLVESGEASQGRLSLRGYSVYYLDQLMVISATLTLTVYILYLMHGPFRWLLGTLPVVVMGIFRYYHLTHQAQRGEPSRDLFADPLLLLLGGIYGILAILEMTGVPFPL